ncbi:MAG: manganese efflux pump [Candidatus Goldbacteria bacterium]|nr:manganese efflux pump [Candidatus Goldiibacteriota bacterium]
MDCFAVSLSAGTCRVKVKTPILLKMALMFGIFQAGMTLIGWLVGSAFAGIIEAFAHWIAFSLLLAVGGKMIAEALKKEEDKTGLNYCSVRILLLLSVATSIDALAVGVSFSILKAGLALPVIIIGLASFIFSIAGGLIGRKTGEMLGNKAEIFGGIILIGIGIKILIEHL